MRVALFATCLADQLFPDVAVASVRLLRHLGVEVDVPERQTCCGQPAYNAGYHDEARAVAEHHLRVFAAADADAATASADRVVLPSGSCGAMVARHYPDLLREAPERFAAARDLAARTRELTTFIVEDLGVLDVGADLSGVRVTWHDSCHALRSLGVRDAPRALLRAAGAELIEAADADVCCGFGGLFSVKMPAISAAMARDKIEGVRATGAEVLASTDAGCLMQLRGRLQREGGAGAPAPVPAPVPEVVHIAELLWRGVERRRAAA